MDCNVAIREFPGPIRVLLDLSPIPTNQEARTYTLTARAQQQPSWLEPTLRRIAELLQLQDNWDSYGAAPISLTAGIAMLDVLNSVMSTYTAPPSIVPSASGHLQAEWHMNGIDLEIEVFSPASVAVYYRDQGSEWEDLLSSDLTSLTQAINRLATR